MAGSRTSNSEQWSAEAKLAVVLETRPLNEAEKTEYCRQKGLYPEQIERWCAACLSGMSSKEPTNQPLKGSPQWDQATQTLGGTQRPSLS